MAELIGANYDNYREPGEITILVKHANKLGAILPQNADITRINYYRARKEGKLENYWESLNERLSEDKENDEVVIEVADKSQELDR